MRRWRRIDRKDHNPIRVHILCFDDQETMVAVRRHQPRRQRHWRSWFPRFDLFGTTGGRWR